MDQQSGKSSLFKTYSSIIWLLCGIIAGSILGLVFGKGVEIIKPLGDIFLNLLFTAIIPLIFFTIASSIASLEKSEKLGKLFVIVKNFWWLLESLLTIRINYFSKK